MSEYGESRLEVNLDNAFLDGTEGEHVYIHIDNVDEYERDFGDSPHIYAYDDEGRKEDLFEAVDEARFDYIMATGIIWPAWIRSEMPLETDVLRALEWVHIMKGYPEEGDIEIIREELEDE